MAAIDTRKAERRTLRFNSIDEMLKELDRIVAADKAGKLRCTGNWTAGQVIGHIATWINYGYEGFPSGAHPPWFIRMILKFMKKKYVRDGVKAGVKIPSIPGGTYGQEPLSTQEGAAKLRAAMMRIQNRDPVKFHSPAFGEMQHDERVAFQLRHAELHFGFLHY